MHVDQNRRHEGQPRVGDDVGRLQPPPGSVYSQQFVNRRREIAKVPQTRAQTQSEQLYFGAANAVAAVNHQAKVKVQRRACGESDEPENLKRREFLRLRDVRNKQKQNCLKKERHCGLRIADLSSPRILLYIAAPLARDRSPIINPQSAIRNPQSAILNESRTSRRCNSRAPWRSAGRWPFARRKPARGIR